MTEGPAHRTDGRRTSRKADRENVWQFIKFGLVGVANTGVYYVLYWALLGFMYYMAAHLVAYALSVVFSFFMNCRFTYHVRPTWRRFILFPLSAAANFVCMTAGTFALVEWAHMAEKWAPLVAGIAAIPLTFVLAKYILTGKHNPDDRVAESMRAEGAEDALESRR